MTMSEPDIGLALVNIVLLGLLFVVAIAIARLRSLFAIVMLSGIDASFQSRWSKLLTNPLPRPTQMMATSGACSDSNSLHGITVRGQTSGWRFSESKIMSAVLRDPLPTGPTAIGWPAKRSTLSINEGSTRELSRTNRCAAS